jgi:hypothetical protein
MSLTKKTMIAFLKIEMLGMSGKDRRLTKQINTDLNTSQASGFYQKCKIDRGSVRQIIKTAESARAIHRSLTRPFGDDGSRLLPATRVKEYTTEMRSSKQDFESAIHDIEIRWPVIIANQHSRLQSSKTVIFIPEDYPFVVTDPAATGGYRILPGIDLMPHYKFAFKLKPTPNEGHIVIDLEAETIAEIKAQLKKDEIKNMADSKLELWRRIIEPVKNMAKICSNDQKVYKSLISNIEEELDILRDLNVNNDIDMTLVLEDIKAQLTGYTAGQIKDDKRLKAILGQKAQQLTDTMDKYVGNPPK